MTRICHLVKEETDLTGTGLSAPLRREGAARQEGRV